VHPFRPAIFQGQRQKGDYFEGWYYKQSHTNFKGSLAFIPGMSLGKDPHSFIQVIDGHSGKSWNQRFDLDEFEYQNSPFQVRIGKNIFSKDQINLDLPEHSIRASLQFSQRTPYPWKPWSPGIMGPYTFAPFMECYHGVLSLDHTIEGQIEMPDGRRDFNGGRGYIEKDWGKSFPESWVWMQGNLFEEPGTSFMLSIARVPWRKHYFTGIIGFVLSEKKIHTLATYKGCRIIESSHNAKGVQLLLAQGNTKLRIQLFHKEAAPLKAPAKGKMDRIIKESVESEIRFELHKGNKRIAEGHSTHCGSEICGHMESLL